MLCHAMKYPRLHLANFVEMNYTNNTYQVPSWRQGYHVILVSKVLHAAVSDKVQL